MCNALILIHFCCYMAHFYSESFVLFSLLSVCVTLKYNVKCTSYDLVASRLQ